MKIVHIIDSLSIGGAEKLIREIVPLQVADGLKVDVILLNGVRTHLYDELESLECCKIYSLSNSFYNPLNIFKLIPFLKQYDLAHVHLFPAQYYAVFAKIFGFSKVKLIFTEHNTVNRRLNNYFFRRIDQFVNRFYCKIICITPEVMNIMMNSYSYPKDKLITILNGVNVELILNKKGHCRSDFGFLESDVLLVMVAAFRTQKDQDTVIKTLKKLPENFKLILVGDGERKNELTDLCYREKIKHRVFFLGNRGDVYNILKMCDISILSSHWEGFGLVAIESLACKIPLIISNVEGLSQVVEDKALKFEIENSNQLYEKIIDIIKMPTKLREELVCGGIEHAYKYDLKNNIDSLKKLYLEILNK
ncbi:glycosyltransferase [Myroides odoratimimus]|uniref:glycosyltransferase n=1 Tax=Myroides odoratimimus TaxID=76832 RepID=UPI002DBB05A8|nr:glycosyltransferase [Myroides odoratimimus]MEC4086898.1 glycosyltransferase [Myroides odoratimimus]